MAYTCCFRQPCHIPCSSCAFLNHIHTGDGQLQQRVRLQPRAAGRVGRGCAGHPTRGPAWWGSRHPAAGAAPRGAPTRAGARRDRFNDRNDPWAASHLHPHSGTCGTAAIMDVEQASLTKSAGAARLRSTS